MTENPNKAAWDKIIFDTRDMILVSVSSSNLPAPVLAVALAEATVAFILELISQFKKSGDAQNLQATIDLLDSTMQTLQSLKDGATLEDFRHAANARKAGFLF